MVFGVLAALREAGTTIVVFEHKLELLHAHADRLHVLAERRVAASGEPTAILADPRTDEWGVGATRYTRAARLAREQGLGPADAAVPVSFEQAAAWFGGAR
ncbi:MAG: hypothetical protein KDB60_07610, partial [Propionibacteriaceae bacterium]|nr:hypothetical protein [Propionibacteriaceae bacterium]